MMKSTNVMEESLSISISLIHHLATAFQIHGANPITHGSQKTY